MVSVGQSTYDDNYPGNKTWGQFGTHDNTKTGTNNALTMQDGTTDGVYRSDIFDKGRITVETVIYQTENLNSNKRINLTLEGLTEQNAIQETKEISLKEGRYSADLANFSNYNYEAYRFEVEMFDDQGSTDDKPELENLSISGELQPRQSKTGVNTGIQWLFIFAGLILVVKDVL